MNPSESKDAFLQDCLKNGKYQSSTIDTLKKKFNGIEPFEIQVGNDLADFNEKQFKELIGFLSKSNNKETLYSLCSPISKYYQWCINNERTLNASELNNAKKIHNIIDELIPDSAVKYFSKEKMQYYVNMIHDITDKFIAYSFFFNIKNGLDKNTIENNETYSDFPELIHLKISDLNEETKILYLSYSNREIPVDDFFIDLMKRANEATYYDNGTENFKNLNDYVSSEYVLKRMKRKGSLEPLTQKMLEKRFATIKIQSEGHIDFSTASMNGLVYFVQRKFNIQHGISLEEALISDKYDGKGYIHEPDTERYIGEFHKGITARTLRRKIRMYIDKYLDNENNDEDNRISIIPEIRIIELKLKLSVIEIQKEMVSNFYNTNQCRYVYTSANITWRNNTLVLFKNNEYIVACARIEKSIPNMNSDAILYFYPESTEVFRPFTMAELLARFPALKFYKGEYIVNPSPSTISEVYMMINENADGYDISVEIAKLATITAEKEAINLNLLELWEHVSNNQKMNHYGVHKHFSRDLYLKELVKRLARGNCQFCEKTAPFIDANDRPYLEEHHVEYLANGGADALHNVIALCPNCHKQLHIREDEVDKRKAEKIAYKNVELLNELLEKNSAL